MIPLRSSSTARKKLFTTVLFQVGSPEPLELRLWWIP